MVRIVLLKDAYKSLATGNVHALIGRIVIEIVGIGGNAHSGDHVARGGIEYQQSRRSAATHKEAMVGFVERHREITLGVSQRPFRNRASVPVDHSDLMEIRQIHKNGRSRFFQLERFRMRAKLIVFRQTLIRFGVHDRDSGGFSIAVSDVNALTGFIVAQIVDVTIKGYGGQQVERGSIVNV